VELIINAHEIGHEGVQKTYLRLKKGYYWRGMKEEIRKYVSLCDRCQLRKSQPQAEPTEVNTTPIEAPFVRVGLDIIGPLTETQKGNKYIMVLVDYFTKWVEAEPTKTITSYDVISFLLKAFCRHGIPEIIVTDNGVQFTSDITKAFVDLYGSYIQFVATYHPESNGLTENRNREIGKLLRTLGEKEENWDTLLFPVLWALKNSTNSATGFSSFQLLYGRNDLQPFDLLIKRKIKDPNQSFDEYLVDKFIDHCKWLLEACDNIENANTYWAERRKEKLSLRNKQEFKVGDKILY